ncbi:MAG: RNA polymerase factor sigma-54, partial [Winogradskyella sp.]
MALKQYLQFKLSQKLSPQQIQLMKLIQLPTQAFEQRLKQEIEENPALDTGKETKTEDDNIDEFDNSTDTINDNETIEADDINVDDYLSDDEIPEYRTHANNYSADDEDKSVPYAAGTSFTQHLINQLNTFRLSEQHKDIAYFLVGSVDESGYIRRTLADITDDLAFTQNIYTTEEEVEKVLKIVHQLDPAGVGARNLQECLSIQLHRKTQNPNIEKATAIIDNGFEQFTKKHYKKLMQKFGVNETQLKDAIEEIERLNPKPGGSYAGNNKIVEHVVPDFAIKIVDGELELTLNGRNAPELHVSREYNNMLKGYKDTKQKSKAQKDAVLFIKQKLDAAKWFIEAVMQRQQTLFVTMSAIMNYQKKYFLTGDERNLRPMILKDIGDQIQMDVSTISREYNNMLKGYKDTKQKS